MRHLLALDPLSRPRAAQVCRALSTYCAAMGLPTHSNADNSLVLRTQLEWRNVVYGEYAMYDLFVVLAEHYLDIEDEKSCHSLIKNLLSETWETEPSEIAAEIQPRWSMSYYRSLVAKFFESKVHRWLRIAERLLQKSQYAQAGLVYKVMLRDVQDLSQTVIPAMEADGNFLSRLGFAMVVEGGWHGFGPDAKLQPIHIASRKADLESVLWTESPDSDSIWAVALTEASGKGHEGTVEFLLQHDLKSDQQVMTKALERAVEEGRVNVVRMLLQHVLKREMDCNACVKPALTSICYRGRWEIVETFVECGADIDSPVSTGLTPLHIAAHMGFEKMVEMLLRHDADIHKVIHWSGCTALHRAAEQGQEKVVNILLSHITDVDRQTNDGDTALSLAAEKGHESVVKILLEHKANVEMENKSGMTALHQASRHGNEDVVTTLLAQNVDAARKDKYGKTALEWARENGHGNIVNMLSLERAEVGKPTTVEENGGTKSNMEHQVPAKGEEAKIGESADWGLEKVETVETADSGNSVESEALPMEHQVPAKGEEAKIGESANWGSRECGDCGDCRQREECGE
jgi:ankyrin repeat protein